MAEANASGNTDKQEGKTGNTGKDTKNEASKENTEKEGKKTVPEIFANYVAARPRVHRGARVTRAFDDTTGYLIFEDVSVSCCHGGENIPADGFRGGGQDIPTGHQSGYSGNPPAQQPAPAQPKAEQDCFDQFKKAGDSAVEYHQKGFRDGKECCGGHRVENKTPWGLIVLVIALVAIAAAVYIYKDSQALGKTVKSQVESPTPEPSEDSYKQTYEDEYENSDTEQSVAESHIHPVEFVEPEPVQVDTYGDYMSADAELTLAILVHLTGPEAINFRYLKGDSLDGHNKFVIMAAQVATLIKNGKGVRWVKDKQGVEKWDLYPTSYSSIDQNSEAGRMARLVGEKAMYSSAYQNEESFEWCVNNAVQLVPESSPTDYSKAVARTIDILEEKAQKAKIPSINGKVFFAVNHIPSTNVARRNVSRKSDSHTRLNTKVKPGIIDVTVSPLPNGYSFERGVKLTGSDHHHGYDLSTPCGNPVVAVKSGKVIKDAFSESYGNLVAIDDGTNVWQYAHLKKRSNKSYGSRVKAGERIGLVGNTGHSKGCHLHLECWTRAEWNKREKDQKAQPNKLRLIAEVQIGPRLFAF